MNKVVILIILVMFVSCYSLSYADSGQKNYCHDPQANAEWNRYVKQHPQDFPAHAMHAIRIGLCKKIDRGEITLNQGVIWFKEIFDELKTKRFREDLNKAMQDTKEDL